MLFGNQKIRDKVVADAKHFVETNGRKLIYGAMCGSISKGIQMRDSDYDSRFLYIEQDFPATVHVPKNTAETEIIRRYYTDGIRVPYEWIPCWEMTSFIQYLKEPYIEGKLSYGLYNTVGWTLQSPYAWDPYGLQNKLIPLVNSIFEKRYAIGYYLEQIDRYWDGEEHEYIVKEYIYAVYAALQIQWVLERNSFPPVYFRTLAAVGEEGMQQGIERLLLEMLEPNHYQRTEEELKRRNLKEKSRTMPIEGIERFILKMRRKGMEECEKGLSVSLEKKERVIREIYRLIRYAVLEEQQVDSVSDFDNTAAEQKDYAECWYELWNGTEYGSRPLERTYVIRANSRIDSRRMRIKLKNSSNSEVRVVGIFIGNQDVHRMVTLGGNASFALKAGQEVYSDIIDIWLYCCDFEVRVEYESREGTENCLNCIESIETWRYER